MLITGSFSEALILMIARSVFGSYETQRGDVLLLVGQGHLDPLTPSTT